MYGQMYGPFFRSCEPKPISLLEHDLQSPGSAMSSRWNRPGKVFVWVYMISYEHEHGTSMDKPSKSAAENVVFPTGANNFGAPLSDTRISSNYNSLM